MNLLLAAVAILSLSRADSRFKEQVTGSESPVMIEAKEGEITNNGKTAVFRKDVRMTRDKTEMRCEVLRAEFDDEGRMTRVTCSGNVVITQPGRTAVADDASYDRGSDVITLSGWPKVAQGENTLTGRTILIHVSEDRVEVSNVKAKVIPPRNEGTKTRTDEKAGSDQGSGQ